ncbi:hypothetical protein [Streptomyces albogriseolus]|uniref:hypothetical protein n=1 Tax=Streptomyces albogriseolus TaxID=1887 RepID=UPI00345F4236
MSKALDADHPPVGMTMLHRHLPKGVALDGLRQDRMLNEALETGDPLKLMRCSASRRTAKLPR